MGYKTILFSNPCELHVKNFQLVYSATDSCENVTIPLEDISTIVLEHHQIKFSNYFLYICGEYNITVLSCDKTHRPSVILTPFYTHSRNTKVALSHIQMGEPLKKRLWQKIVQQKIKNQSNVLKILFSNPELDTYPDKIQSGDKTNIEGQAAKKYWNLLFTDFKRHSNSKSNAALDYGYAIIRGTLSKFISATGLIPCVGIHHCNELNAFNLTEDLIEPFRPFVDLTVAQMNLSDDVSLTKAEKGCLINILNLQCQHKNEQVTIQTACERVCNSFVKSIGNNDYNMLELPKFIGDN